MRLSILKILLIVSLAVNVIGGRSLYKAKLELSDLKADQTTLLPCPVCNSTDIDLQQVYNGYQVYCNTCHSTIARTDSKATTVEFWNGVER